MADKIIVERPIQHILVKVSPLSTELKNKVKLAVEEIKNKIKEKHL